MHLHEYLGWPGPVTMRQHEAWYAWLAEKADREAGRKDPREEAAELAARREARLKAPGVKVVTKTRTEVAAAGGPEAAAAAELRRRAAENAAARDRNKAQGP